MITLSISTNTTAGYISTRSLFSNLHKITAKYNYSSTLFHDNYRDINNFKSFTSLIIYDFNTEAFSVKTLEKHLKSNKVSSLILADNSKKTSDIKNSVSQHYRLIIKLSTPLKLDQKLYSQFYIYLAKILKIDSYIDQNGSDLTSFYSPIEDQKHLYINSDYALNTDTIIENFYESNISKDILAAKKKNPSNSYATNQRLASLKDRVIVRDTHNRDIEISTKGDINEQDNIYSLGQI